ncbi:hypothetical protein DTO027B5_1699 [Paecilomyces variotii]|nr:hypothetical protein DTO027B3_1241 [Paecilomyces variotii]KAJ9336384.1 hypothetical protein DTO027B5_1699 [Paecilomyces variotii]
MLSAAVCLALLSPSSCLSFAFVIELRSFPQLAPRSGSFFTSSSSLFFFSSIAAVCDGAAVAPWGGNLAIAAF